MKKTEFVNKIRILGNLRKKQNCTENTHIIINNYKQSFNYNNSYTNNVNIILFKINFYYFI